MADAEQKKSLSGTVGHIIFRNEENGYTVFILEVSGKEETCIGFLPDIAEGTSIEAFGEYTTHPSYGRQFRVNEFEYRAPESREAIEAYLGSGAIKGIGRALAGRIVRMFGEDSLRIMEEEPERLAEVRGISMRMAREIGAAVAHEAGARRAMMFLEGYGISLKTGIRIYKTYGEELYGVLKENPYRLAEDVEGIGFVTADRIAARAGIPANSEYRIRSGILYTLSVSSGEGNVYLPEEELYARASDILRVEVDEIAHEIQSLAIEHKIIVKEHTVRHVRGKHEHSIPSGYEPGQPEYGETAEAAEGVGEAAESRDVTERVVYSARLYYLELGAARMLVDLCVPSGVSEETARKRIRAFGAQQRIQLEEEQEKAVAMAAANGLFILTGGPGTGKTTTINEMIRYFERSGMDVLLAAPTGRAAKRMTEATGHAASTIHRLLEITSGTDDEHPDAFQFARNASNPLEADAVIIDEVSMVDISLMNALLCAVAPGTHLVLVGDVDQLPSVGPGAVLRDIIRADAFPVVRLSRIFRQAEESDIIVNAHKINRGEQIALDNKSRDFFFLKRADPDRIIRNVIELVRDRLPGYVEAEPFDIQVLTPMRKGMLGVEHLNSVMQQYLNPPSPKKREKMYGDHIFRIGDKVMQTRNNYQMEWEIRGKYGIPADMGSGIFNGDMGIIRDVDEVGHFLLIEFDEKRMVEYPFAELEDLQLSYAVTIHKSQGSEYPAVVLPLLSGPRMLMTRNLLYTAVTRAESTVVILGKEETVRGMIRNTSERRRFTSLDERIEELCS